MKFGKSYKIRAKNFLRVNLPAHKVLEVSNMALCLDLPRLTVSGMWWVLNTYLLNEGTLLGLFRTQIEWKQPTWSCVEWNKLSQQCSDLRNLLKGSHLLIRMYPLLSCCSTGFPYWCHLFKGKYTFWLVLGRSSLGGARKRKQMGTRQWRVTH